MLWFVLANEFSTKKNLPKCFISFALSIERLLSWNHFKRTLNVNDVDKKVLIERHVSTLNYVVFFMTFSTMFICNLAIWLSIF